MKDTVIRSSSTPDYADCPERWAVRNLRKEITALGYEFRQTGRSIGASNGTAVHKSAAHILTGMMETGDPGSEDDAVEVGHEGLKEAMEEEEMIWDNTTPDINAAHQQVSRQARLYHSKVAPGIKPIAVEQELKGTLKEGFILVGHLDVSEEFDLHDLKTGRNQRANAAQYGCYSLLRRTNKQPSRNLIEDYVRRVGVRTPQPDPERVVYPSERAEQIAAKTLKRIIADIEQFRETEDPWSFLPNPNSMLCSDRFCPAWGTNFCGAWREKK